MFQYTRNVRAVNGASQVTGGGVIALDSFTLTVPATGTAGLLGGTQTFTGDKTFSGALSSPGAGVNSTKIGSGAAAAGTSGLALGVSSSAGNAETIVLGRNSASTANNQMVVGSSDLSIRTVFIGKGVSAGAPLSVTIQPSRANGSNIAGADVVLASGASTGNAASGRAILQTAPAGSSGSSVNTLKDRWSVEAVGSLFGWQESTVQTREVITIVPSFVVSTDASRTGRAVFNVYDTAAREAMRMEASGTAAMIGFLGATAVARTSAYTPTNVTTDRAFDADTVVVAELADVVGTLIADLQAFGLLG